MTGFFEESAGVRSMSRLAIGWLLGLATVIVGVVVFYVVKVRPVDAAVIGALGAVLGAVVYHGAVAIKNRNAPDEPTT
jgi:hypothetical protein